MRTEMVAMMEGDLSDPQALAQIAAVAHKARDLFAVISGQPAGHPAMNAGNTAYGGSAAFIGGSVYPNTEQFGAKAIRELVGLLPEVLAMSKKESPAEIAEAMRIAKEDGDEELHKALRDKLMGKKPAGIVEATAEVITTKAELLHCTHESHEDHEEHEASNGVNGVAALLAAEVTP